MPPHSDKIPDWDAQREKIIGLGEASIHKSYYPELRQRLAELLTKNKELEEAYKKLAASREEIQESEARYRALYQDNPTMIFTTTDEGEIISVNRAGADQFGYSIDTLTGNNIHSLGYPEDREGGEEFFSRCRASPGQVFSRELRRMKNDGAAIWVEEHARNITGPDGSSQVLVVCQDITERKQAEEALGRATKKLNLLNIITFTDIQNAMFSLTGYLELEKELLEGEEQKRLHSRQADLVRIILGALKFARHYQSLGLRPPAWYDVTRTFFFGISHLNTLEMSKSVTTEGFEVYADPLLENVFFNLAENVILHARGATRFDLGYEEGPEGLILVFSDNGPGVPADMKERIFQRRDDNKKGMGLFLTREILSITDISIAETGVPGEGARFEIHIPRGAYRYTAPRT